eukprot:1164323-Alexandrium_andersonii.AAC.1
MHRLLPAWSEGKTATSWSPTAPDRSHSCPAGVTTTKGSRTSMAARTVSGGRGRGPLSTARTHGRG